MQSNVQRDWRWERRLSGAALVVLASATGAQAPQSTSAPQSAAVKKDTSGARMRIYGFAQGDLGYEFKSSDPNWFDVVRPTKLPAFSEQYGKNGRTFVSVRQSRFGVEALLPTASKSPVKAVFDFDMFGVGVDAGQTTIRLRHAYGQWGAFGAGQIESPFMDLDVFPNILDYWGPAGMLFFRNVMAFWQPMNRPEGSRFTVALERPGASGDAGQFADRIELQNVRGRFPWPDLSAEYRLGQKWGYLELAGILRSLRWDDLIPNDAVDLSGGGTGWGLSLSSNFKWRKDALRFQAVGGEGIQNYFNDAPTDVGVKTNPGNLRQPLLGEVLPILGLTAYIDHTWNSKWTSSLGYSRTDIDNSDAQSADAFKSGQYASINLLAYPVANVMMGGELQWAYRKNRSDGWSTNDFRFQMSFKYSFSHRIGGNGDEPVRAQD
jgi:hypothetical protein